MPRFVGLSGIFDLTPRALATSASATARSPGRQILPICVPTARPSRTPRASASAEQRLASVSNFGRQDREPRLKLEIASRERPRTAFLGAHREPDLPRDSASSSARPRGQRSMRPNSSGAHRPMAPVSVDSLIRRTRRELEGRESSALSSPTPRAGCSRGRGRSTSSAMSSPVIRTDRPSRRPVRSSVSGRRRVDAFSMFRSYGRSRRGLSPLPGTPGGVEDSLSARRIFHCSSPRRLLDHALGRRRDGR